QITNNGIEVSCNKQLTWRAQPIVPARQPSLPATVEIIEQGQHYLWLRMLVPDHRWPRILELRADSLGTVAGRVHLQSFLPGDARAPNLGWCITGPTFSSMQTNQTEHLIGRESIEHQFDDGQQAWIQTKNHCLRFPDAHLKKRGLISSKNDTDSGQVTYLRCRAEDRVPHQHAAWRNASFVLSKLATAPWTALLEPPHKIHIDPEAFSIISDCGTPSNLSPWPILDKIRRFHIDAIAGCSLLGDDFGNVTSLPQPGVFGMNRLNHCPAIFHEYYRAGDARLRNVALLWCNNFHDLSIWWGTTGQNNIDCRSQFGGTRYNNMARHHQEYQDDKSFMWRSNSAVNFCTKGYDSFFYAYEETGDPRMATALRWQIEFAKDCVHANQGECRNIGDVLDFINLYRMTGRNEFLHEGMRLFRELRTRLSEGDLFSQGGRPIVKDPPFIDNDSVGYKHPFAKPYIIGYALAGLPALAEYFPNEPKLRDVVRAVADFLARAQDPLGGWRYPHPRSSSIIVSQGIEHAAQLANAVSFLENRGESVSNLLDAIERTLQARILAWKKSGKFFGRLRGWEASTGILGDEKNIYDLYKKPEDRDRKRDYTEGSVSLGNASPEAVVYFSEVLNFYLARRPAERLYNANPQLKTVLERIKPSADYQPSKTSKDYPGYGVAKKLPIFRESLINRLSFPLRFDPQGEMEFKHWRSAARARLFECLLVPPPRAAFEHAIIGREDRGTYQAQKIAFNVSADCRVPAYLLVPKGRGPFPAVIALHDHGAHFLIGKEKVVRPFDVSQEILTDAQRWVEKSYGDRFIGDELAKRGYVVFSMDALFWGERGLKEGVDYNLQQALASNLLQMGMTWIGVITWDDIRSAEFVASLPQVDPQRIGAVGLSMGCHRTWMLSAASDRIAAGIAVCWLGTTEALMSPGNNQTKGHSAYSMLVPNLRNYLDYPHVAAIACPKPMTFYNGEKDGLFPVAGVLDAYKEMRRVWESQGVSERLLTKTWPLGHVFNVQMQEEAFDWLDNYLRPK
ncbi:MAG: alpha/beta hydrolase family protein, partial [Planctomycetota bacterium]